MLLALPVLHKFTIRRRSELAKPVAPDNFAMIDV